jgi:hypothetical protein
VKILHPVWGMEVVDGLLRVRRLSSSHEAFWEGGGAAFLLLLLLHLHRHPSYSIVPLGTVFPLQSSSPAGCPPSELVFASGEMQAVAHWGRRLFHKDPKPEIGSLGCDPCVSWLDDT